MCAVPEPVLSIVAGCIPITVALFRRATWKIKDCTKDVSRATPLSYEDRMATKSKETALSRQKRLEEHLYPMSGFLATESGGSVVASVVISPSSPAAQSPLGSWMSGLGNRTSGDGASEQFSPGRITVLTEVHIDNESMNSDGTRFC